MSLYRVTCAEMNKSVWVVAAQRQGGRERGRLCLGILDYWVHFSWRFKRGKKNKSAWLMSQKQESNQKYNRIIPQL